MFHILYIVVLNYYLFIRIAGWGSLVIRGAHNPEIPSSNLGPATFYKYGKLKTAVGFLTKETPPIITDYGVEKRILRSMTLEQKRHVF